MKRIASLAAIAAAVAFGLCQGGVLAQNAVGYCPPGAKFCPTPGSAPVADNGFGMGSYAAVQSPPAPTPDAYFQSQLKEGEQLIMVAPGGDFANVPAPGQAPYAPPASYAPPANLYVAQAPVPAPAPMGGYSGGYAGGYSAAPAPVAATSYAPDIHSDGLRGFVPPLPGSQPSQPSYSTYETPVPAMGYAPMPTQAPAMAYSPVPAPASPGPAPLTAAAFHTPLPQSPAPIPVQARPRPEAVQTAAAPQQERTHPYQNTGIDQKKRRADKLSEVANETSRRRDKIDLKPRPENRKPWWKGGFWNRKSDASAEKKSRAEAKADKLAARKAKEDAKRAEN